jgi:acyl-CoA thioesterase-2
LHPKVAEVLELLQLERIEDTLFRGQSRDIGTRSVFGGQVLGQALSAAQRTVEPSRRAHSLHAYFLRAGDIEHPIVYSVENTRDGGSFSVRRITAIQHGKPIFVASASFNAPSPGPEHQTPAPSTPMPEALAPYMTLTPEELAKLEPKTQRWLTGRGAFEFRPVHPRNELAPEKRPPHQAIWFKLADRIDDDAQMHNALLAYASDFFLIGTALLPHALSYIQPNVRMASLDHAMWFHRPFRVDEWFLYVCESPTMQDSRALARGSVYTRDGVLVASTAQEGMIRVTDFQG